MATFYGRIANILPNFPEGYKQPENGYSSRLQDRAEECGAIAQCCDDETYRRRLVDLAEE
jgi:hypothetical protein